MAKGSTALDELIPKYALNKSELESYKKLCEKENAEIKSIMQTNDIMDYSAGGYTVKYIVSERETINEEKLLEIAHEHNLTDIIKTKEYIDFDALEKAIYNGNVEASVIAQMSAAKEVKEVVTLRVSHTKGE